MHAMQQAMRFKTSRVVHIICAKSGLTMLPAVAFNPIHTGVLNYKVTKDPKHSQTSDSHKTSTACVVWHFVLLQIYQHLGNALTVDVG